MKILQIIDTLRSGGKERQLVELLTFLSKRKDVSCELIILSENIYYTYINILNVKIYHIVRNRKKDLSVFYKFYKLFKKIRPDVIHSWGSMCSIYLLPVAQLLGIKVVNGFLRDVPPKLKIRDKAWIRSKLTFPFSDKIIANSFAGLKAYRAPKGKSTFIHNGFNFNRIAHLQNEASVIDKFNIETKFVVGMVATFSRRKDYPTLINAAQIIFKKRDDVTFVCVGDGELINYCKNLVKPWHKNRIKFLGRQKDVESIVNIFDVGVLATNDKVHGEGISNSLMEYMALAKPVVATDCGGNKELVKNKETGFLIMARNPELMAQKIYVLLDNQDMAKSFGINGRKRLEKKFNFEKMGEQFLNLYLAVIEK